MPLLVTSAAGANGNGYGTLLAFDLNGRSLGAFSGDSRIADPRGMAVDRDEGLLFLNSGTDRVLALDPNGRVVRDSGPSEGLNLRARANARVTNKKALSEIATSLLEAGQAKRIYDYLVVDISRSDLATRKKEFAWSEDDIPESMGLEAKPTTVPFSQFEFRTG